MTRKLAPLPRLLDGQMPAPKWALGVGSGANVGGPFDTCAVGQGGDQLIPVDLYVPGCPPVPQGL